MSPTLLGARALGTQVELHYLSAPAEVLFERIQRRGAEDPPLTRADIDGWLSQFEVPSAEELALFDPSSRS